MIQGIASQRLFHRFPMLRVERVLEIVPGRQARARVVVAGNDVLVRHGPFYPPLLLVEAIAQVAALYMEEDEREQSGTLAALSRFEFGAPVPVGAEVEIRSRFVAGFGKLIRTEGEALVGEQMAVRGEVTIAL